MKGILTLPLILMITTLTACQSTPLLIAGTPFTEVPLNSHLMLNQELDIAPGQVAVYIQNGKIIPAENIKQRQPNCKFEINTIEDTARKVMPDKFKIDRFILDSNFVSSGKILLAGLGIMHVSGGSATAEIYTTELFLHSDKQPDVLRLSCEHWEDPADGDYLTLDQIKRALGKIIEFI